MWAIEQRQPGVRSRISGPAPHTSGYDSSFSQDARWFIYSWKFKKHWSTRPHMFEFLLLFDLISYIPLVSPLVTWERPTNILGFLKHAGMLLDYGFLSGCSLCLKWSPPDVAVTNSLSCPLSLCWNITFLGIYLDYFKINCPSPEIFNPSCPVLP